jgi:putative Ca2+/H+ antiporter (TMEM165/GDT1 family)
MTSTAEFFEGAVKSGTMILISEIGDKTFFIAAIMAMRHSRATVFAGAIGALGVMTALSAALGWAAPALISKTYTHYLAVALFFFFGCRSLYESLLAWEGGGMREELAETEKELAGSKRSSSSKTKAKRALLSSSVLAETFVITFLAEWGDRSQIATIGLAASEDPFGVTLGGVLGHAVCTGAAVIGGKHMATRVSERAVAVTGGALFVLFGAHALVTGVGE